MPKIYPLVLSIFTALLITGCSGGHTQTLYADMEEDEKPTDDTVLRVSDEYTAAFGGTVGDTLNPVLGSDNKWHVLYELMLTNGRPIPASIREIKVVDYDDTDRVLHTITEAEIISAGVDSAGRSRLEAHDPILVDGDAVLQPNESMALYIDMVIDSINDIPDAIVHKFFGSAATNPGSSFASDVEYLMVPRALNKNELPAAGSPVTGDSWVVINGCCDVVGAHRGSIQTISGQLWGSQRFAIDWMKIGDNGKFFEGDPADVTSWYNYGEPVFAVADGTVVEVLDELPDQPPGQLPDPNSITINTVDGNHVILDIGQGVYVFYAHLKLGSVGVKAGDKVLMGDMIGKPGNSGNTSAPHLHIHFMDSPSALASDGLPYRYLGFTPTGTIDADQWEAVADDLDDVWRLLPPTDGLPAGEFIPLNLTVGDFSANP